MRVRTAAVKFSLLVGSVNGRSVRVTVATVDMIERVSVIHTCINYDIHTCSNICLQSKAY